MSHYFPLGNPERNIGLRLCCERRQIHQSEKHYWRSNERVRYTVYEDRGAECAIVVPIHTDKEEELRTLYLSLPLLYSRLENKKQKKEGHALPEKTVLSDAQIEKAAADYLLSRLALSDGEVPIPAHALGTGAEGPKQRQIVLNKQTGDDYETLVRKPYQLPIVVLTPRKCFPLAVT